MRSISNPKASDMIRQQPNTYLGEYWYMGTDDYGGVPIMVYKIIGFTYSPKVAVVQMTMVSLIMLVA